MISRQFTARGCPTITAQEEVKNAWLQLSMSPMSSGKYEWVDVLMMLLGWVGTAAASGKPNTWGIR